MKVATIILNWNGKEDTLECVESVLKSNTKGWDQEVVVVDNGSMDGSVQTIRKKFPSVTILENKANIGFAKGNNVALEWAKDKKDVCILLNNDTIVTDSALDTLIKSSQKLENVGAVIPVINFYNDKKSVWYAGGKIIHPFGRLEAHTSLQSDDPYQVELFSGCCVLIPTEVIKKVGVFDPRYFLYLEDTDLSMRVNKAGFKIYIEPRATIYHKVSSASGGSETPTPIYYQIRNNLLFITYYSNPVTLLIGFLYMIALSFKIALNTFTRPIKDKKQMLYAIFQGWRDYILRRWDKRVL